MTKAPAKKKPLNLRQSRFLAEYLQSRNATKAAIKAGYSPKTAYSQGHDLLKKPEIAAAVSASIAKALGDSQVTVDRVLREAACIAFLDPRDFYDEDGNLRAINEMPESAARAVAGFEVEEAFERDERGKMAPSGALLRKIRFAPKTPALDLLARHLGMLQQPAAPALVGPNFAIHIHLDEDDPRMVQSSKS
jgi:phage terminase small subunit